MPRRATDGLYGKGMFSSFKKVTACSWIKFSFFFARWVVETRLPTWCGLLSVAGRGRAPHYCLAMGVLAPFRPLLTPPCTGGGGGLLLLPTWPPLTHGDGGRAVITGRWCKSWLPAWSSLMPPWQWHSGIPHHGQVQKKVEAPHFVVADSTGVGLRCFLWCFLFLSRATASFCWHFFFFCFVLFVPLVLLDCWLLQHTVQDRWSKSKPRHIITVSFLGSQAPLLICLLLSALPEFSYVVVYIMPRVFST